MVGFAMASYAIANTIVVQIMPRVAKYVRRQRLLAIATVRSWIFVSWMSILLLFVHV
jgi:hypothetical protein